MYARTIRNKKGITYLTIVESYWKDGKSRQRVLFNMGRLDLLQATGQIDRITKSLERFCAKTRLIDLSKDISVEESYVFGSVYCLKALFERTPLKAIVEEIASSHEQLEIPLVDAVFALLVSRFVRPCSKLKLKETWMERFYPELVRPGIALHQIYRTLDLLAKHKEEIQKKLLYPTSQHSLFASRKLELVFYDTTTLRFESIREDIGELRRFGYSKERRNDCTQVILGLMIDREGLPVGYRLFSGDTYEGKTLPIVLKQLKDDYHIRRLVFVADRGMINGGNLEEIRKADFEFIIGMKLWAMKEKDQKQITSIKEWDHETADFKVKELSHPEGRLIVTWSRERAGRDQQVRSDLLEKLKSRLEHEDDPSSLISHKGFKRYLKIVNKGKVAINQKAVRLDAERDGLFGILTNVPAETLPSAEILRRYKELWKIEDAFGEIKGTLESRPMFHWTDQRIEGHMMVCFLAYYLEAYVTQQLRETKADFTAPAAFDALNQVRAIPVNVRGQTVWVRTKIAGIAAKTLQTLKLRIPSDVLKLPNQKEPAETDFEADAEVRVISNG
jgi:transposase